jgi:hypothetical protein
VADRIDALLPPETRSDEQPVSRRRYSGYLDVIDLHRPRDLHHDLIEKSVLISAFTGQTAQIDKNADIAPDLIQSGRLLFV